MAVDHTRPLPVAPERLDHLAHIYGYSKYADMDESERVEVLKLALLGEQIEWTQHAAFFLSEAYDIYNARFR